MLANFVNDLEMRIASDGFPNNFQPRHVWRTARKRLSRMVDHKKLLAPRVFCQNSGCCGSTYIVQLLSDNGLSGCVHEKNPDFNQIGIDHFESPQNPHRLRKLLRYTRWDLFFEANNRLFSLSHAIADAFPNSQFLHLHRDGREAVRSALSRPDVEEYQRENLRFQGTLAGEKTMRPFVRACHYWNNMNQRILDDLEDLKSACGPHHTLSFDNLVAGNLEALEKAIGRSLKIRQRAVVNKGPVRKSGKYPRYEDWNSNDQSTFWEVCGQTMQRLGYSAS